MNRTKSLSSREPYQGGQTEQRANLKTMIRNALARAGLLERQRGRMPNCEREEQDRLQGLVLHDQQDQVCEEEEKQVYKQASVGAHFSLGLQGDPPVHSKRVPKRRWWEKRLERWA